MPRTSPQATSINPEAFTTRTCSQCQRLHAVPKRQHVRPCTACRLAAAAEKAEAHAKTLRDAADRAYVAERRLLHDIEDARIVAQQRDAAGECVDESAWFANLSCGRALDAAAVCESTRVPYALRRHRGARTAIALARVVVLSRVAPEPASRDGFRFVAWLGFGSGAWVARGGRMSGDGGFPSRTPRTWTRGAGGYTSCGGAL